MIDEIIKSHGLNSPSHVSRLLGIKESGQPVVSTQTLSNWSKYKPKLFSAVLFGLKAQQDLLFKNKMLGVKND